MELMPHYAPLVMLAFLSTGFLLFVAAVVVLHAFALRSHERARKVLAAAVFIAGAYLGVLLAASLGSRETVLGPGENKYFCEMDCHEAYSVVGVENAKTLGTPPNQRTAQGTYYVVTLKVWFDENTISARRAREIPLHPNPRTVVVMSENGERYGISWAGQQALEQNQGKRFSLCETLWVGQSYTTQVVFDLPSGVRNPRLYITTEPWLTRWLIGHENSFLHKKVLFRL